MPFSYNNVIFNGSNLAWIIRLGKETEILKAKTPLGLSVVVQHTKLPLAIPVSHKEVLIHLLIQLLANKPWKAAVDGPSIFATATNVENPDVAPGSMFQSGPG